MTGAPLAQQRRRSRRIVRLLAIIFFASGLSSLAYQVVWQRLLTLHYGVGAISITLIVSVYMLGLGLGALAGGRLSERLTSALLAYCGAELLIGAFGAISLPFLGILGRLTANRSYAVALLAMFSFLLIPTLLMGATLPLLVKAFNRTVGNFLFSVSLLYFVNTIGAALGALVTAYGLISFWGLDGAVHCAVILNVLLAASVFLLARGGETTSAPGAVPGSAASAPPSSADSPGLWVYPLVFVSGFLAIGYELVWFRLIVVLNKASPYAFATSLSVYLLGIGLGSGAAHRIVRWRPETSRLRLFLGLQFLTGVAVVILVGGFAHLGGDGPLAALASRGFSRELQPSSWRLADLGSVFLWPLYFELVPTLLIGAGFPLLASLALRRPDREGASVGRVYFVNTIGNMVGAGITGFVLLGRFGTERTLLGFAATNLLLLLWAPRPRGGTLRALARPALVGSGVLVAALALPRQGELYRAIHREPGPGFDLHLQEGVDGVVATFERGPQIVNYIDGLIHGGRPDASFAVEAMEALSVAPRADRVLIIGFGTGTITEVALRSPGVEHVTLVELSRTLLANLVKIPLFRSILADPRLEVIHDDGRRFLLHTGARYDLVLMDPLRTTTAYSNNLYSLEFFRLVARHLSDCGVLLLWTDDALVVPRTAATAFPHVALYPLSTDAGFLLASACALSRSEDRLWRALGAAPPAERPALARWLLPLRPALERGELLRVTAGHRINRDFEPVSEYYLGPR